MTLEEKLKTIKLNYSRVNGRERFDSWEDDLIKLIEQAIAEEREACAKLVQEMGKSVKGGYNNAAHEMATAIRERK